MQSHLYVTAEDPRELSKQILALNTSSPDPSTAKERADKRARIITANRDRLEGVLNANTVSADLKRTVVLQDSVRAFATPILVLRAFSTVFQGVRLEGTDKVAVPYFPLATAASTDWNAENGYVMAEDVNSDAKVITVNKRKYQPAAYSSSEIRRLPYLNIKQGMAMKAEKLGVDVVTDVLSIVTAENYGAAAITDDASAFDSDDVAALKGVADVAGWPQSGRSLVLDSSYHTNLLKDSSIKSLADFGRSTMQDGRVLSLYGFDIISAPTLPDNSENLGGFACWPSALLVAFAPIEPAEGVNLARYEVYTDPITGAQFEYRAWGDPDYDKAKEVVEANYGYVLGEAAALKRIAAE